MGLWVLVFSISSAPLDLPSYCKGMCQPKYMDGTYINEKCACIDYEPISMGQSVKLPVRVKKRANPPMVYDGVDVMSYPAQED